MSPEPDVGEQRREHPLEGTSVGTSRVEAELTTGGLTYGRTPSGEWSLAQAQHDLKVSRTLYQQEQAAEEARHRRQEEAKDNAQRRLTFYVILFAVLGVLVVAFLLTTLSANGTTRAWAQGVVSLIVGGIVGGVAGYFTGKGGA